MYYRRCINASCGRPFQVNRFSTKLDAHMEFGKITCPHCGLETRDDDRYIFLAHALSAGEEAEFESRYPLRLTSR